MDSPAPLLAHGRPVVRRHRASLSACLVVLALVAAGCGDDDTDDPVGPEPAGVGFEADVQPIFDLRCTQACHSPPTLNGSLDLSPGESHAHWSAFRPTVTPTGSASSRGNRIPRCCTEADRRPGRRQPHAPVRLARQSPDHDHPYVDRGRRPGRLRHRVRSCTGHRVRTRRSSCRSPVARSSSTRGSHACSRRGLRSGPGCRR